MLQNSNMIFRIASCFGRESLVAVMCFYWLEFSGVMTFNLFLTYVPILITMKTRERFSDVFRGCKIRMLARKGLICEVLKILWYVATLHNWWLLLIADVFKFCWHNRLLKFWHNWFSGSQIHVTIKSGVEGGRNYRNNITHEGFKY